MAESLRQLIADFTVRVDAAGEMKRGAAGIENLKAKFQSLDATVSKAGATTSGFFTRLSASLKGGFGLGGVGSAVNASSAGIQRGVGGALSAITSLQAGLAALAGGYIGSQVKALIDDIGGIGEEAARLGVANDEFQRLKVLAEQNATSVGALGTAFRTIGKAAVDPTKETTAAFQKLGVALKGADGNFRSRNDLFFDSAMALADVANESERATLAQQLYGRSAIELLPLLSQGSAGIAAQRAELEKLPVVSDAAIEAADRFGDRWPMTMLRFKAVAGQVLEKFVLPALEGLLTALDGVSAAVGRFVKWFNPLTAGLAAVVVALSPLLSTMGALVALGGGWSALARTVVVGLGRIVAAIAPAVAAFLILEDLFVFFAGGKSLIGRGLEKAFGPGIKQAVTDLRDAVKDLWGWITGENADIGKFKALVDEIGLALRLMIHNTLVALGLRGGEAGLAGLEKYESPEAQARRAGPTQVPNARGGETGMVFNPATGSFMAVPNSIPAPPQPFGPPPPPGAGTVVQANGDRVVNITMAPGTSPTAMAGAVGRELERDRNSDLANVR